MLPDMPVGRALSSARSIHPTIAIDADCSPLQVLGSIYTQPNIKSRRRLRRAPRHWCRLTRSQGRRRPADGQSARSELDKGTPPASGTAGGGAGGEIRRAHSDAVAVGSGLTLVLSGDRLSLIRSAC